MLDNNSPLMKMLGTHMRYMTQRQSVIAHNIANADTPNYRTQDMIAPDFDAMVRGGGRASQLRGAGQMRQTSTKHLPGTIGSSGFRTQAIRDAQEITPVGNNVVLEQEMAKVSETGAQFQISSSLMRKFTGMYRSALGQR